MYLACKRFSKNLAAGRKKKEYSAKIEAEGNQRRKDRRRNRGFKQKHELHLEEWLGAAGWRIVGWVKGEPWLLASQILKHSYGHPLKALNTPGKTSVGLMCPLFSPKEK